MSLYSSLRWAEAVVAALVLTGVVALVSWATVTRYLGHPNIWVLEVTQVLFAWTCLLAASIAFRKSSHFSVSLLEELLPPKLRGLLRLLQQIVMLVLLVALGWVGLDFVEVAHRRPLPLTGIRFSWVAVTIPVACMLMGITCIENIVRELRTPIETGSDEETS